MWYRWIHELRRIRWKDSECNNTFRIWQFMLKAYDVLWCLGVGLGFSILWADSQLMLARVCVCDHSIADTLFPHLPEMGQGPLHCCLPCFQRPLLLHTHTGSFHCWLLARKIQVRLSAVNALKCGFKQITKIHCANCVHVMWILSKLLPLEKTNICCHR